MAETKTALSESGRILQFTLKDEQDEIFTFKHNKNGHHYEATTPAKNKRVLTVPGLRFMGRSGRSGETVDLVLVTSNIDIEFKCLQALRNNAAYTQN
ncbi:unnamed protein product, partial [Mesorhabditis belari]|uniref:Uncharacterized protein n=1 Tax=Mesorhabditis belari TaxID=2138241 RepID=A0AAF3J3B0_9BILA